MADRLAFHYLHGESLLHRWDARCKLAALLFLTFGLLHARTPFLAIFTVLVLSAFRTARAPIRALLSDMKGWSVFLTMIFFLQAFSLSNQETRLIAWLPVSREGLKAASLACWRLGLILCSGMLFTLVTRPQQMQEALLWFMKPLPFLPARRIALMFSLVMRFLPLLLDEAESVRTASRSRLGNLRKNPLVRIKYLILPVFRRSLLRADDFAIALASRGYTEDIPVCLPRIRRTHLSALLLLLMVVLVGSAPVPHFLQRDWSALADLLYFLDE